MPVTATSAVEEYAGFETLKISAKVRAALISAGLDTVDKLVEYQIDNPFSSIPGIGDSGAESIRAAIEAATKTGAAGDIDVGEVTTSYAIPGIGDVDEAGVLLRDPDERGISPGERGRRHRRLEMAQANGLAESTGEGSPAPRTNGEPEFVAEWRGHVLRLGPQRAEQQFPELLRRVRSYIATGKKESNPIELAADQVAAAARRRAAEDSEYEASRYRQYAIVVARIATPVEGDAEFLADFSREFQISVEDMRRHAAIVGRGSVCWERHCARDKNREEEKAAREELRATIERCEKEVAEAERRHNVAIAEHHNSTAATGSLRALAREMPLFFDAAADACVPVWIDDDVE